MTRPRVFFDFSTGSDTAGRVVFELYDETAPKTVENFRALCTGERGLSVVSETPLYYKNSIIHRSIRDFMIQGGDFTKHNGTGGESIYGSVFPDEDLSRPLDAEGLLCMANRGPNTNGSQFFITLRDCPHLNGKHVVFGKVIRGYEVVQKLAGVPVDEKDRPQVPIIIVNCGELELRRTQRPDAAAQSRKTRKRRNDRSRSRSPDRAKESRRQKLKRMRSPEVDGGNDEDPNLNKRSTETEEEYDIRLEREERERIEAAKRKELEHIKRRNQTTSSRGSIHFKGRGRMKFIDPELHQRQ
ncbi:cyclophilin-like domain-containing protein [Phlebopus sp. FC_14]|nr:cyclophilin-like domain-containing protein [Phlebopus sp. FC_14]